MSTKSEIQSLLDLPGSDILEKYRHIGIVPGDEIEIQTLSALAEEYDILIILYFEEDLARNSQYEKDIITFQNDGEYERPFIRIDRFIDFQRRNNPVFDEALAMVPLMVEIITAGTMQTNAGDQPLVTALLPFLDELDLD
ncbi:MAG: hypothetical protein JXA44_00760 [Methanospirillaceae archaeon]|nr:hypothetical protein [Methanospirillaceae archaeon]